jgi:hypothetical protein
VLVCLYFFFIVLSFFCSGSGAEALLNIFICSGVLLCFFYKLVRPAYACTPHPRRMRFCVRLARPLSREPGPSNDSYCGTPRRSPHNSNHLAGLATLRLVLLTPSTDGWSISLIR